MKRLLIPALLLTLATLVECLPALAHANPPARMSVAVLKGSGPHQICGEKGKDFVTFYLRITDLTMDAHIGKRNVPGHGHVQMYLDKIPSDAYRRVDLRGIASSVAPGKIGRDRYAASIEFDFAWIKIHRGHHNLLIGLARNDEFMYAVKAASFALDVK